MSSIIEKLEAIKARFDDLGVALTNPEIVTDNKRFSQVSKEYRKLERIVDVYKVYRTNIDSLEFAKEVLETESDDELRTMAKEDIEILGQQQEKLETDLRNLLIPKDPLDEKNAIIEIRAGTGGDESAGAGRYHWSQKLQVL